MCHFEQRRRGQGSGISKEKQTTHRKMRKSDNARNKFSLGHPEATGHGWKSNTGFARFLSFCHVRFIL